MKISQMLAGGRPLFSFEFFPPKDEPAAPALMETVLHLQQLKPDFVSVTYGAGGSTRTKTLELVARIKHEIGMETMAHLTCVGHSKTQIREILKELADRGIENIIALRGDPPKGQSSFQPSADGFQHANELVEEAARMGFCVAVAGYPEKHPEAKTLAEDLRYLKRKVDAGASFVITQLFFQNAYYFDFVAQARALGIRAPIIPGLMPVTNFAQVQRFSSLCGATLPSTLTQELASVQSDMEAVTRIGVRHAAHQGEELLRKGAPGIHFYTLNKSRSSREILEHLKNLRQPAPSGLLHDV
jgi:methylenetetrahydrofolate reductase (NADPH)